jgi:hypothetical protein
MIAVALLALVIGATVAIVTASGSSRGPASAAHSANDHPHRSHGQSELGLAASYLDVSRSQLRHELRTGTTLAEIAGRTSGKSATGLVDALFATKAADLEAQSSGGELSKTKLKSRLARLVTRIDIEVYQPNGPGAGASDLDTAAVYLAITRKQLRDDQQAGRSLAQIADSTSAKSAAGLIDALVSARKQALAGALAAKTLTSAEESSTLASLRQQITKEVDRVPSKHEAGQGKAH